MTTVTTVLGLTPMALDFHEGFEIRIPLALTLIVLFPRLDRVPTSINRHRDPNALIEPNASDLQPLIEEFEWDRGLVAGAFSFGFLVSAVLSPE